MPIQTGPIEKKPPAEADTPTKIMLASIYSGRPLLLSKLAQAAGLPRQVASYHVNRLVGDGLLIPAEEKGKTYYSPQPIFLDDELFSRIVKLVDPVITKISKNLIVADKNDAERVLRNNAHILFVVLAHEALRQK